MMPVSRYQIIAKAIELFHIDYLIQRMYKKEQCDLINSPKSQVSVVFILIPLAYCPQLYYSITQIK